MALMNSNEKSHQVGGVLTRPHSAPRNSRTELSLKYDRFISTKAYARSTRPILAPSVSVSEKRVSFLMP